VALRVARNVKRRKGETMIRRWVALGIAFLVSEGLRTVPLDLWGTTTDARRS
jgi:hypothetical protein